MKFYTGLQSIFLFHALFDLLSPYLRRMEPWRGAKRSSKKVRERKSMQPPKQRKLAHIDQFFFNVGQTTPWLPKSGYR